MIRNVSLENLIWSRIMLWAVTDFHNVQPQQQACSREFVTVPWEKETVMGALDISIYERNGHHVVRVENDERVEEWPFIRERFAKAYAKTLLDRENEQESVRKERLRKLNS